ncbi:hypothetical protein EBZ39_12175 [bacterium]|nr:hypothetical protein [bacterium]
MSEAGDQSGLKILKQGDADFEALQKRLQPLQRDTSVEVSPSEVVVQAAYQKIQGVLNHELKELPVGEQLREYNQKPEFKSVLKNLNVKMGYESEDACPKGPDAVGQMLACRCNAAKGLTDEMERKLVDFVRAHFSMSHDYIKHRYGFWHEADEVHDLYVSTDALEAFRRKTSVVNSRYSNMRPSIKDLIRTPYARAIADTRATYMLAIFGGTPAFRFEPTGTRSKRASAKLIERVLSENMRRIGFERNIYQMAMDQNRYGLAPIVNFYNRDGNSLVNWDPYSYFPDPRVTSQNRHEADFEGYRSWASVVSLYRRGIYQKLDRLKKNAPKFGWECNWDLRNVIRGQSVDPRTPNVSSNQTNEQYFSLGDAHIINTLYVFMHPNWLGIPGEFGLYRITVADECTVIMFDKSPYPHKRLPGVVFDGDYDAHKTFTSGIYDLMMPMQRFQDWLLRSRVENVQAVITNRVVVDPLRINMMDLTDPNPQRFIRTLPGADPAGAINPITVQDATRGYWNDLDAAGQLMQRLTAASDTAQGIQTETERSATEIARITALGQQRMGTQARLTSANGMRQLAQMMLQNLQYFGIDGGLVKLPQEMKQYIPGMSEDGWYQWKQSDILGDYDYLVVDGTLPIDPRENTNNLIRAIKTLAETGTAADWKMNKFIEAYLRSEGFEDVENWKTTEVEKNQQMADIAKMKLAQQPQLANQPGGGVIPNEDVAKGVQNGNLVPMDQALRELGVTEGQPPIVPV